MLSLIKLALINTVMKKIFFLLAFIMIAAFAKAQTQKPKADTPKKAGSMPYAVPQGNMPMRVIVPKYTGPMPAAKPDSNKSVNKSKKTTKS